MPRLLLLRHAKAERAGRAGPGDFDRALSKRGRRDAAEMGQRIAARGEAIDLVLCSSSARTRGTWEELRPALPAAPDTKFLRAIYDGRPAYPDLIRAEAGEAATLLLIGHNPSVQETAILLAGDLSGPEGAALNAHVPTAGLVVLDFDGGWPDLAPGACRLVAFLAPRADGED